MSEMRSTWLPMISAVIAASSATGKSLVPAQATTILPARFSASAFFDRETSGEFVMDGRFKFFSQETGVLGSNARDENALLALESWVSNFQDLFGSLARAEDDFRKSFSQRAMRIDLSEAEVHDRRGLEGLEDLVAAHATGSKFFQQLDCFSCRHAGKMRQKSKKPSAKSQCELTESADNIVSLDMMTEQALAVFQQIPDDYDVERQDSDDEDWMCITIAFGWRTVEQFEYFNRNEEHRFENGHPANPFDSEQQPGCFNQRKEAVNEGAGSSQKALLFADLSQLKREVRPEFSFRIEAKNVQHMFEFGRKIIVGKRINNDS